MIVVVSISKSPDRLRGYLTRWLFEIDRCTYVGRVSAKVADELWMIIQGNLEDGRAVMVRTNDSEQGFAVLSHHQRWELADMDGVTLLRHPLDDAPAAWRERTGWSNNAKRLRHRRFRGGT